MTNNPMGLPDLYAAATTLQTAILAGVAQAADNAPQAAPQMPNVIANPLQELWTTAVNLGGWGMLLYGLVTRILKKFELMRRDIRSVVRELRRIRYAPPHDAYAESALRRDPSPRAATPHPPHSPPQHFPHDSDS